MIHIATFNVAQLQCTTAMMQLHEVFEAFTGLKLIIQLNGSKGYLDNIAFEAEGNQKEDTNRLFVGKHFNFEGEFNTDLHIAIYHSQQRGIVIETQSNNPASDKANPEFDKTELAALLDTMELNQHVRN